MPTCLFSQSTWATVGPTRMYMQCHRRCCQSTRCIFSRHPPETEVVRRTTLKKKNCLPKMATFFLCSLPTSAKMAKVVFTKLSISPVFTSLPSGYVENSYGLTDPNPSTSGDWSSVQILRKAKSSASYVAIEPHNSDVCKSPSMNINTDEEENTHTRKCQGSEGIMDKDERGVSPGYVVFPTKTSRDSGVVMGRGDQGKSSIGYASLQVFGLDTQIFQSLKENTDRDGKGISTKFVAFPAADFTTRTPHGLRENNVRDEQGRSSGYKVFPAANFVMQTSSGSGEKSVRDELGRSSGYMTFPAANFVMQTSNGSGENSVKDEQEKSTGYVSFPPTDFRYITLPAANFVMQTSSGSGENNVRDEQGRSSGYIAFPAANFVMQTSSGSGENNVRDEQGRSSGYIAFPAVNFVMQTSSGSGENNVRDEQGRSSGYIAFPAANFVMQTSSGSGENNVRDEQGRSSGYITYPAASFVMQTSNGSGENNVKEEQEKSTGYVSFPPTDFREISINNFPFPSYVALPPVGFGPYNPQSSIGLGQINRLAAESKTHSKQEANKRDLSVKTGAYVAMDYFKVQSLKGETDARLSPALCLP
ncbi:uncharacterized protein LOC125036316 isoform X1 [Penaeus chinensis]|uniref:uncharacterized protein LOC125036316 isoform X1 n=1 Tax=Penaeus chinensis TaxID=139456 RepID=UPI001FB74D71|nr:uncharacterized protein LOC125036316 isoform X1 [Penaeus chinensis]XP_047484760.1 uncharacterized protein LOC125036316 isoform X1 [Penaeus chinensis]